jgi:hypothetical protein
MRVAVRRLGRWCYVVSIRLSGVRVIRSSEFASRHFIRSSTLQSASRPYDCLCRASLIISQRAEQNRPQDEISQLIRKGRN